MFREGHVLHVYVILSTGRYDVTSCLVPCSLKGVWSQGSGIRYLGPEAEGMVLGGQYTLPAGSDI